MDEIINKVSNTDDDQDKQKIFKFEFFTGEKFDSLVRKFGLSSENMEFLDFLQWDYCKEILISI